MHQCVNLGPSPPNVWEQRLPLRALSSGPEPTLGPKLPFLEAAASVLGRGLRGMELRVGLASVTLPDGLRAGGEHSWLA